jgi:hypothetical protein
MLRHRTKYVKPVQKNYVKLKNYKFGHTEIIKLNIISTNSTDTSRKQLRAKRAL